jgi:hypothetical protein
MTATTTRTPRHRAWPGPGVRTCSADECGQPVHPDANAPLGWAHDDPALDTPADTTPDGLPLIEERENATPIVRCADCGGTSWQGVGETSFVYQRTAIDTTDDHPSGDDYDSGYIDVTWTLSAEFAECADCGTSPSDEQRAALERAIGATDSTRDRFARILSAAGALAGAIASGHVVLVQGIHDSDPSAPDYARLAREAHASAAELVAAIAALWDGQPADWIAARRANPRPLGDELPA